MSRRWRRSRATDGSCWLEMAVPMPAALAHMQNRRKRMVTFSECRKKKVIESSQLQPVHERDYEARIRYGS